MRAAQFDARYQAEGDPWGYRTSDYERAKYAATLAACGAGPFASALELGASIGIFSALLAPRCEQLTTIDFSEVAVAEARRELADLPQVEVLAGEIPAVLPSTPRDLIVASEILYYLEPDALTATIDRIVELLTPGGRVVAVHWRPDGPERPFGAQAVHDRLHAVRSLAAVGDASTEDYLLEAWQRT